MEPIFAQLSLEYFKAGKTLPWNKVANPIKLQPIWHVAGEPLREGQIIGIAADTRKARSYFRL